MVTKSKLIILKGGKVLVMGKNHDNTTRFVFPGGNIKRGESAEEAVLRETYEEIGIRYNPDEIKLLTATISVHHKKTKAIYYFITEKHYGFHQLKEPNKFLSVDWVDQYDLPKHLNGFDKKIFKDYILKENKTNLKLY